MKTKKDFHKAISMIGLTSVLSMATFGPITLAEEKTVNNNLENKKLQTLKMNSLDSPSDRLRVPFRDGFYQKKILKSVQSQLLMYLFILCQMQLLNRKTLIM